ANAVSGRGACARKQLDPGPGALDKGGETPTPEFCVRRGECYDRRDTSCDRRSAYCDRANRIITCEAASPWLATGTGDSKSRSVMSKYLAPFIAVVSVWCLVREGARAGEERPVRKPRVDQHGDPLPNRAVLRLGTTRWRLHESPVIFSPNGRYAILPGAATRLVDAATGNTLRSFPVRSITAFFTGDNKTVILGYGEKISWLNVETGKITRETTINGYARAAWSADGKRVVYDHQIKGGDWN